MGPFWGHLGTIGAILGAILGLFTLDLWHSGPFRGHLGAILGGFVTFGAVLGVIWGQ